MDAEKAVNHYELVAAQAKAHNQQVVIEDLRAQLAEERAERQDIKHTQLVIGIVIGIVASCIAASLAGAWS